MAAGTRNKNGKPVDFVKHYGNKEGQLPTVCNNKKAGYITSGIKDVTCLKCINAIKRKNNGI